MVSLKDLLGLSETPPNGLAWHDTVVAGLPTDRIRAMHDLLKSPGAAVAVLEALSDSYPDANATLPAAVSDYLYRIARSLRELLVINGGNLPNACAWVTSAQPALRGRVPLDLLQSQVGTDFVFAAISRIEPVKKASRLPQDIPPPDAVDAGDEESYPGFS